MSIKWCLKLNIPTTTNPRDQNYAGKTNSSVLGKDKKMWKIEAKPQMKLNKKIMKEILVINQVKCRKSLDDAFCNIQKIKVILNNQDGTAYK